MDESHLGADDAGGLDQDESINISDVIEVINTDPDFQESSTPANMFSGGGEMPHPSSRNVNQSLSHPSSSRNGAFVRIIEQPASKALRFRYECEGRSAGSIPGASSTPENKTFPAIRVEGYTGRAVVVVSCVTKDPPYKAHPHNLVGREGCKQGVCTMEMPRDTMCMTFSNLGIQCVKKKDIESALRVREEIKVDPFREGFAHRNQPTSIDLNAVRLCFQVFIENDRKKLTVPLEPVVSEPIYDKKAMSDLLIVKLSHCNSFVDGGRNEIILLCEKVAKEDIQIRFFEVKDGRVVWEDFGEFQPSQVHKQTAICFKAPKYRTLDITEPVKISIQLRRPSDGATSEALPFEYLPLDAEPGMLRRKRQKIDDPMRHLKLEERVMQQYQPNVPNLQVQIKSEPRDKTPSPFGGQMYIAPSHSPSYQLPSVLQNTTLPPIENWMMPSTSTATVSQLPLSVVQQQQQQQQMWQSINNLSQPSQMNSTEINALLNMDTQNVELQNIELNSGDLNILSTNLLSDSFSHNLSLTELPTGHADGQIANSSSNMTDSFTRLANNAYNQMINDNNL